MTVRKANDTDMKAIMQLVQDVFEGEQGIPRQMHPIPEEKQPQWWCAESDGEIIGSMAAYLEDGNWHLARLAVSPKARGMGIATKLSKRALEALFDRGVTEVHMEARDITVHLMGKLGAEVAGEAFPFFQGNVTPMVFRKENAKW